MAGRLKDIKNMVEVMDGALTARLFGYEMNEKTLIEDYKWLIEKVEKQAEIIEDMESAIDTLNGR